uniref:Phosphate transporter n=3 Tax=environmental samples TaxID=68359 RepID=A0A075GDC3_9EURY|nr:Phosphate transporter family protein (TC.PIT) [uncultured marine group II/III euryarchaeote KM3_14_C03]AIF01739.1 Phosphate transporter family protein (TC.PIT) [uncultured marine group II/III euryarchaeote KM3_14_D03]
MEPVMTLVLILSLAVCAYMAWNIGANDVANAMGTSVGSRALTLKQAVIVAAIFEFAGAFFAGDAVTDTVRKGILYIDDFDTISPAFANDLMYAFIAAMMAAAVWLTIATRLGLPVSTTHSIIGGILGVGLVLEVQHSTSLIDWEVVSKVVMSWVASPLMGALLAFFTFYIVRGTILEAEDPIARSKWLAPILAIPTFFVLGIALQFKALKGFFARAESNGWIESKYDWLPVKENGSWNPMVENAWFPINSIILALIIATIAAGVLAYVLRNYEFKGEKEGFHGVERIFVWLQVITAAYVAFAHGANDRSNAIGPMAAVYQILSDGGRLAAEAPVPTWLVLLGSIGIAIGVMTWGWRVMDTIGHKITDITPTRGFAAEFGAATTILLFSMPFLAVPVSTTHTLVGAVVGVGLAGGAKNVDFRVFGKIVASWVASLPAAGFGSVVIYVASGSDPINLLVIIPISFLMVGYVMWVTRDNEIFVEDALADAGGDAEKGAPTYFELFHTHAEAVEETVNHMLDAVNNAVDGKDPSEAIEATILAELNADNVKNDLRRRVGSGKWNLLMRSDDFYHMLARQDRIADYAQNVAEQLSFRPLYDNAEAKTLLKEMAQAVAKTAATYEDTVEALRDLTLSGYTRSGREKLGDLIDQVNLAEHESDLAESRAAGFVFSIGEDDPLAAVHMYRVLQRLDDVSNACETAANGFLPMVYN